MLDFRIEITPKISIPKAKVTGLKIESCSIRSLTDDYIWSSFDEMSYSRLNQNNYSLGALDIEIGLTGYHGRAYPSIFTKCFELRTNDRSIIKPMKFSNEKSISKINKRGELSFGLRYYFRTEDEIQTILKCDKLLFEFFVAIGSVRNTYALMCQIVKVDGKWELQDANTYRLKDYDNIKALID